MGLHLGVIRLHPLHSPPFVRVCFRPKHIFGFMGPCTSHLIMNLMLGLRQRHILKLLTKMITQILHLISTIIMQVVHEIIECYVCGIK